MLWKANGDLCAKKVLLQLTIHVCVCVYLFYIEDPKDMGDNKFRFTLISFSIYIGGMWVIFLIFYNTACQIIINLDSRLFNDEKNMRMGDCCQISNEFI